MAKPKTSFRKKVRTAAELGADELIAFFTYKGDEKNRLERAKIASAAISRDTAIVSATNNKTAMAMRLVRLDPKSRQEVEDALEDDL